MSKMVVDLDLGSDPVLSHGARLRHRNQERWRIQDRGGTVGTQAFLLVNGRYILRTHYTMPDAEPTT